MGQRPLGIALQELSFFLPWPTAITLALYFNIDFSMFDTTLESPMYTNLGSEGSVRNEVQDSWKGRSGAASTQEELESILGLTHKAHVLLERMRIGIIFMQNSELPKFYIANIAGLTHGST